MIDSHSIGPDLNLTLFHIICDIFISHLWNLEKCTFHRCAKMIKFQRIFDHTLTISTKQGISCNYWLDLVTLNNFNFIKSTENWAKKCLIGLTNIWSNRGRCVSLSWKFVIHAKISLSQHSRTIFKLDLTCKFLSVKSIYFFPTWGGRPCTCLWIVKLGYSREGGPKEFWWESIFFEIHIIFLGSNIFKPGKA